MGEPNYTIRFISAEETVAVRHAVLRINKPIETCFFDGDTLQTTHHLGLFFEDSLIGVASFMKHKNEAFPEVLQYQLRGMAILKEYQKKGLGKLLIHKGNEMLAKMNVNRLWFNARKSAVYFYENNGFKTVGKPFYILGIGIHFLMTKD